MGIGMKIRRSRPPAESSHHQLTDCRGLALVAHGGETPSSWNHISSSSSFLSFAIFINRHQEFLYTAAPAYRRVLHLFERGVKVSCLTHRHAVFRFTPFARATCFQLLDFRPAVTTSRRTPGSALEYRLLCTAVVSETTARHRGHIPGLGFTS